jgi:hypothetical protein
MILFIILLVFLIILFIKLSKEEGFINRCISITTKKASLKSALLLTTSVSVNHKHNKKQLKMRDNYRKKMYLEVINKYKKIYKGPIYVVDSSGYDFSEFKNNKNIKIFSFDINKVKHKYINKTPMEALSIIYAYKYFKLNRYDIIFKVTGKYFLHL